MKIKITRHDFAPTASAASATDHRSRVVATTHDVRDAAAICYGLALANRGRNLGFVATLHSNELTGYTDLVTAYAGHDSPPSLPQLIANAERRLKEFKAWVAKQKRRLKFLRPYFDAFPLKDLGQSMEDLRKAIWHDEDCKNALDREDWLVASSRLSSLGFDLARNAV